MSNPTHHYYFQVFAPDDTLDALAGADRDAVPAIAEGEVSGKGQVVGTSRIRRTR